MVSFASLTAPSDRYTPTAEIAIGHKSCTDKYTVVPSDTALHNRAKAGTIRVAVCGKCISEDFALHVAYMSGDKVPVRLSDASLHSYYLCLSLWESASYWSSMSCTWRWKGNARMAPHALGPRCL